MGNWNAVIGERRYGNIVRIYALSKRHKRVPRLLEFHD